MATYRLLQESAPFFHEVRQRALADRLLDKRKLPIRAFGQNLATRVQFLPRTSWERKDVFVDRERLLNATICQVSGQRTAIDVRADQSALYKRTNLRRTSKAMVVAAVVKRLNPKMVAGYHQTGTPRVPNCKGKH